MTIYQWVKKEREKWLEFSAKYSKEHEITATWDQVSTLNYKTCYNWGSLLNLLLFQFPHLLNCNNSENLSFLKLDKVKNTEWLVNLLICRVLNKFQLLLFLVLLLSSSHIT